MANQKAPAVIYRRAFLRPGLSLFALLALAVTAITQSSAQDVSARFPDPSRVTADYPDEAQRYAAFERLDAALNGAVTKPVSRTDYNKLFSYEAAYNSLDNIHMMAGIQSPAYRDWIARRDPVLDDPAFAKSVLEKYQLTGLKFIPRVYPDAVPTPAPVPAAPVNTPNYPPTTYTPHRQFMDQHHMFLLAMPVALVSWFLMYFVTKLLLGRSGTKGYFGTTPPLENMGDLPPLPEALRTVQFPGIWYPVKAYSGLVLNKQTSVTTSTFTSTTPSQVNVIGNTAYVNPGQTTTHVTRRQTDNLRMRTPDQRESHWTFTGQSGDRVFPGQIISTLARPMKDGSFEFLLAYNHSTGELIRVEDGLTAAHNPGGFLNWLAQPAATLIGTVGFAIVLGYFLTSPPPIIVIEGGIGGLVFLMAAGFCSLTAAFFMVNLLRYKVRENRNARLLSQYGPQLRSYFDQLTPGLQKRFTQV